MMFRKVCKKCSSMEKRNGGSGDSVYEGVRRWMGIKRSTESRDTINGWTWVEGWRAAEWSFEAD